MNLLLADTGVGQWILLGVLLLILIVSPFLMRAKNKKEVENQQKLMDAVKKGDTILTSAGVIGKVVGIDNKEGYKTVTIETGDEKHKGYMCIDIASIYYNLSNPTIPQKEQTEKSDATIMPENLEEQNTEDEQLEQTADIEDSIFNDDSDKLEKKSKSKKSKK